MHFANKLLLYACLSFAAVTAPVHSQDACIPGFQWWAFEMNQFG
jgi:hypothetical protein